MVNNVKGFGEVNKKDTTKSITIDVGRIMDALSAHARIDDPWP